MYICIIIRFESNKTAYRYSNFLLLGLQIHHAFFSVILNVIIMSIIHCKHDINHPSFVPSISEVKKKKTVLQLNFDMDAKRHVNLTPQKRPNEAIEQWRSNKRTPDLSSGGVSDKKRIVSGSRRVYNLKVLLPNAMTVMVKLPEGTEFVTVRELAERVKQQLDRAEKASNPKKSVDWDAELCFVDDFDNVYRKSLKLTRLELNRAYNFRLHVRSVRFSFDFVLLIC